MHRFSLQCANACLPNRSISCSLYSCCCDNAHDSEQSDPAVAQFPHELIAYGGNGAVFQNWAQYRITMKHLCEMTDEGTLVMYSGHPLGLFPSNKTAPRVVVTNGMVIPNHSSKEDYDRMNALGVSQYGQMTAGSYSIGLGIVHGPTITLMNAARLYLDLPVGKDLSGVRFVTSGLGGCLEPKQRLLLLLVHAV